MSALVRTRMTRGALGFDCLERGLGSICGDEEVGILRCAESEEGRWRGGQRESSNTRRIWDISVTRQLFRARWRDISCLGSQSLRDEQGGSAYNCLHTSMFLSKWVGGWGIG